jgi:hypothetical protein
VKEDKTHNDQFDFWQVVQETGYAMEGESQEYERHALDGLYMYMEKWFADHPEIRDVIEGDVMNCPLDIWALYCVKRLVGAFAFNKSLEQAKAEREAAEATKQ